MGSSNGQLGEGGASRSVMSLRLAPGAHWGVAYLCLQPGPRLRPPLAPLQAPPTARSALSRVALLVAVRTQLPCSSLTWLAPGRARRSRRQGLTAWSGGPVTVRSQRPSSPQTRKAQARADVVRLREARPPRGRGGRVGSVPGCLPLCVPEGGRGLDRSARGHGWHPERAGTRCRRLTTLARRGGLGRERPDVVLQPG